MNKIRNIKRKNLWGGVDEVAPYINTYWFTNWSITSFYWFLQKTQDVFQIAYQFGVGGAFEIARLLVDSNLDVEDLIFEITQTGDAIFGVKIDEHDQWSYYDAQTVTSFPYTATAKKKYLALGILFYDPDNVPWSPSTYTGSLTVTYKNGDWSIFDTKTITYLTWPIPTGEPEPEPTPEP